MGEGRCTEISARTRAEGGAGPMGTSLSQASGRVAGYPQAPMTNPFTPTILPPLPRLKSELLGPPPCHVLLIWPLLAPLSLSQTITSPWRML